MKFRIFIFSILMVIGNCCAAWAVFCSNCGKEVAAESKFCAQCGKPVAADVQSAVEPVANKEAAVTPAYSVVPSNQLQQSFQVTSRYLMVNGYQIYRNSIFWIAELNGVSARVWTMIDQPYSGLVMGWVSLAELEKRSTLKPSVSIQCVEPPAPSAQIVIVERPSIWYRWGFHSGSRRSRHGHHH